MTPESKAKCPICGAQAEFWSAGNGRRWECPRCAEYVLDYSRRPFVLGEAMESANVDASVLSHKIRRAVDNKARVIISEDSLASYGAKEQLPNPREQADNLILWIGSHQKNHTDWATARQEQLAANIGTAISANEDDLSWLSRQLANEGLYDRNDTGDAQGWRLRLTMNGWKRYDDLTRRVVAGRIAFMAMAFGQSELDSALDQCFRPAAKRTGFELRKLNEGQPAGLIDNQIRTRIRTARLVIADLTHDNDGAYFEAGFAEGLGINVIYTCEEKKFKTTKTHFDTNHMVTILWDLGNLKKAEEDLTGKIRNTLPDIAKMTDD